MGLHETSSILGPKNMRRSVEKSIVKCESLYTRTFPYIWSVTWLLGSLGKEKLHRKITFIATGWDLIKTTSVSRDCCITLDDILRWRQEAAWLIHLQYGCLQTCGFSKDIGHFNNNLGLVKEVFQTLHTLWGHYEISVCLCMNYKDSGRQWMNF